LEDMARRDDMIGMRVVGIGSIQYELRHRIALATTPPELYLYSFLQDDDGDQNSDHQGTAIAGKESEGGRWTGAWTERGNVARANETENGDQHRDGHMDLTLGRIILVEI
jgi:hypothetical protein